MLGLEMVTPEISKLAMAQSPTGRWPKRSLAIRVLPRVLEIAKFCKQSRMTKVCATLWPEIDLYSLDLNSTLNLLPIMISSWFLPNFAASL